MFKAPTRTRVGEVVTDPLQLHALKYRLCGFRQHRLPDQVVALPAVHAL